MCDHAKRKESWGLKRLEYLIHEWLNPLFQEINSCVSPCLCFVGCFVTFLFSQQLAELSMRNCLLSWVWGSQGQLKFWLQCFCLWRKPFECFLIKGALSSKSKNFFPRFTKLRLWPFRRVSSLWIGCKCLIKGQTALIWIWWCCDVGFWLIIPKHAHFGVATFPLRNNDWRRLCISCQSQRSSGINDIKLNSSSKWLLYY